MKTRTTSSALFVTTKTTYQIPNVNDIHFVVEKNNTDDRESYVLVDYRFNLISLNKNELISLTLFLADQLGLTLVP